MASAVYGWRRDLNGKNVCHVHTVAKADLCSPLFSDMQNLSGKPLRGLDQNFLMLTGPSRIATLLLQGEGT